MCIMKKYYVISLLFFVYSELFSQNKEDLTKTKDIKEVVIVKNKADSYERKLNVKWSLQENEELVSLVENGEGRTKNFKSIQFKILNTSNEKQTIKLRIYKNEDNLPKDLLGEKELTLEAKDEINKVLFENDNQLLKAEGVFLGFQFQKGNNGKVYIFTKSVKHPQTYILKNGVWESFGMNNQLLSKYSKVDIYFKIK